MFAKGYNNIRASIETQYGILSQMVYDIDNHYQTELQQINNDIRHIAEENSDGDLDVYMSIVRNFDDQVDRQASLCVEARKILFCSIFSYYEKMLQGIADYYNISSRARQVPQLYEAIQAEYNNRYADTINIAPKCVASTNETYRLLRNYFMHGNLSNIHDRNKLYSSIDFVDEIKCYGNLDIEITQSSFLYKALDNIRLVLTSIEDNFSNKAQAEWRAYNEAEKYFSEAIKLYPSEYSGVENEYPLYCSISVHYYLEQAEQICLHLASVEHKKAKTMLSGIQQLKKQMSNLGLDYHNYQNAAYEK